MMKFVLSFGDGFSSFGLEGLPRSREVQSPDSARSSSPLSGDMYFKKKISHSTFAHGRSGLSWIFQGCFG